MSNSMPSSRPYTDAEKSLLSNLYGLASANPADYRLREDYYNKVKDLGDPYGALAAGVPGGNLLTGAVALNYARLSGFLNEGVVVTDEKLQKLSLDLMTSDYESRMSGGLNILTEKQIEDSHAEAFRGIGLTINDWTAETPLQVLGPSAWNTMQSGFGGSVYIYIQMAEASLTSQDKLTSATWLFRATDASIAAYIQNAWFVTKAASVTVSDGFGYADKWLGSPSRSILRAMDVIDPIVIAMAGQGADSLFNGSHAYVDLSGKGYAARTDWLSAQSGVLVTVDQSGSYRVVGADGSGFSDLIAMAAPGATVVDASDPIYGKLAVWMDANGDGVMDPDEIRSLSDAGVLSISLAASANPMTFGGNEVSSSAQVAMASGVNTYAYDVSLRQDPVDTAWVGRANVPDSIARLPQLLGHGTVKDLHSQATLDPTLAAMLADLVGTAASTSAEDFFGFVVDLMQRWAGVDGIDPASRGGEIDARRLGFLEDYLGQPLKYDYGHYQDNVRDPGLLPSLLTNGAFDNVVGGLVARLLVQADPVLSAQFTYMSASDLVLPVNDLKPSLDGLTTTLGNLDQANFEEWLKAAYVVSAFGQEMQVDPELMDAALGKMGVRGMDVLERAANQGLAASIDTSGSINISNAAYDGILTPGFGRASGQTFSYDQGDGAVSVSFSEPDWLLYYQGIADNVLYVGGAASDFTQSLLSNGDLVLTDNVLGDSLTVIGQAVIGDGLEHGIQQFVYTDGNIRTQSGNQETYALAVSYGNVVASPSGHQETVALGAGVRPSDVSVRSDPTTGALVVTAGQDSMTIQGNYTSGTSATRVSGITFADGTTWAMEGSYAFGKGHGQQTWDTGGQDGHVRMGADIDPKDVIVQSDAAGDLTVTLRSDPADSLTFLNDFYTFIGGTSSHIKSLDFGDNSSLDLTAPRQFTWIGTATNTTLTGSGWGANEFDFGPGGDTVTVTAPVAAVSASNAFLFGRGDGHATVDMSGGTGVLVLGAGIAASDVLLQARADGSLTVALRDDPADSVTFLHDLSAYFQNQTTQVSSIRFADGTAMSLQGPITSDWIGDAAGDPLTGSNFGPNVFELGTALTPVSFGWAYPNTVITAPGGGGATATANGGTGTLSLYGVSLSDVYFQTTTGSAALTVRFRDSALGPITVSDDLATSFYNYSSQLKTVQASDGAVALAQVTSTWIADAQHTSLVGSDWGPNVFETGSAYAAIAADQSQENEFLVHRGDQGAAITMGTGTGVMVLKGISMHDVMLQSVGSSTTLTLSFLDGATKAIAIADAFRNYYGSHISNVPSIIADDGTIDLNLQLSFTWSGGSSASTLTGSNWGANKFILGAGGDTINAGDGSQGGSNYNTVVFGRGDGHATVNPGNGLGTIQLAAAIAASDVMLQADAAGDLIVAIKGDPADTVTVVGDLYRAYPGVHSRFTVSLADGTSIPIGVQPDGSYAAPRFTWQQTQPGQAMVGSTWGSNDFLLAPGGASIVTEGDANSGNYADSISYDRGDGQVSVTVVDSLVQALKLGSGFAPGDVLLQQDAGTNDFVVAFRGDADDRVVFQNSLFSDGWGVLDQLRGIQFSDGSSLTTGIPYWDQGAPLAFTWVADSAHTSLSGSGYGSNAFETAPGGDTVTLGNGANGGSSANAVRYHAGDGAVAVIPNGGSAKMSFIGIREADVSWTGNQAGDLIGTALGGDQITVKGVLSVGSDIQAVFSDGTLTKAQLAFAASESTSTTPSVSGTAGDDLLDGRGAATELYGNGGNDSYVFGPGYVPLSVINEHAANVGPQGRMLLGTGIDASDLWLAQSGTDLVGTALGTADAFTVKGWFSSDATARLAAFIGGDGKALDSGVSTLVSAMSAYEAANPGFSPGAGSIMPTDTSLQTAIMAAWHQ